MRTTVDINDELMRRAKKRAADDGVPLREHGVHELWTTDKDFHRFPGIAIRNPFQDDGVHETPKKHRIRTPARRA